MCRYSGPRGCSYKTHFACLPCRYTAKFPWDTPRPPVCPRCQTAMVDLGRDFKAPRRGNTAQWRKVRELAAAGITFHSCGCTGPGPRPRTLSDAKSQLGLRRVDRKRV